MAIFANPNSPIQPQPGVYSWSANKNGNESITIYIGNAGAKSGLLPKGTLYRGVSELQRCTFTSDESTSYHSTLDTDFIVGTAILFFERIGYSCVWTHLSNDPGDERRLVRERKPVLQDSTNAKIKPGYKMRKQRWDTGKGRKAGRESLKRKERFLLPWKLSCETTSVRQGTRCRSTEFSLM